MVDKSLFQTGTQGYLKRSVVVEQTSPLEDVLTVLPKGIFIEVESVVPSKIRAVLPGDSQLKTYILNAPRRWVELIEVTYNPPIGKIL